MINFCKALLHISVVVLLAMSFCYSMVFTLSVAMETSISTNIYLPFISFVLNVISMFLLGCIYTKNEAETIERIVNRDINKKYNDIVAFINLARSLIQEDTPKIIDDYIKATRKKADLEDPQ